MAEREEILAEQVDAMAEDVLAHGDDAAAPASPELATLRAVLQDLRRLPRQAFRASLAADLERTAGRTVPYVPAGFRHLTPYLLVGGAARAIDFMTQAFGAEERFRVARRIKPTRAGAFFVTESPPDSADPVPFKNKHGGAFEYRVQSRAEAVARRLNRSPSPEELFP